MKKFYSFIVLTCIMLALCSFNSSAASPWPIQGAPRMLPASYSRFVPVVDRADAPKNKPARAAQEIEGPNYGYLYYSSNTQLESGFYHIDPSTAGASLEWIDEYTDWGMVMTNGWLRDGLVCGMNNFIFMGGVLFYNYVELDFATGKVEKLVPLSNDANDLRNVYVTAAYRDMDDRIYGYGYSNDGESMGFNSAPSTDIDASETIVVTDVSDVCMSLCYNAQDDLFYGVTTTGNFVSVDCTGKQTVLFKLNIKNLKNVVTGIVYNPSDNTYTYNAFLNDNSSAFYTIDPAAKTAVKISDCANSEEYIFMLTTEKAAPSAPGVATFTGIDFVGPSTSGKVTVALPSKTEDGSSLSGQLSWKLFADGNQIASGTGNPGQTVTANVSNLEGGSHILAFTSSVNGKGSPIATRKAWIGNDYPSMPNNVLLTETKVSWDPVTTGANGGYVDLNNLKYTVYVNDMNMGTTSATSLAITLPADKPYQTYTAHVEATAAGLSSEKGMSNPVNYGQPLKIEPSIHYRPEEYELPLFKAVNVDGKTDSEGNDLTWRYTEEMGFPSFASGYDGDDWLFFPPMLFDNEEKAYQFVMEAGIVHDSDTRGRISVYLGKQPTPEAMTQTILPPHQCEHMRGDDILEYFAVSEPGVYYIGIHAVTYSVSFHISDMDIAITDRSALVPVSPTDLSAVPGENGELSATVSFTMPTMTSNGQAIPADTEFQAIVSSFTREYGSFEPVDLTDRITVKGKPGSKQTVKIKTAQNQNLITVAGSINGNVGVAATVDVYTGVVRPYIVQNLKAEVTENNMGMKLTWTPPVEGETDGPIGNKFFYTIWYYNDGWEFGDYVGWDVMEYTYNLQPGAEQQWIRLGIMALNDAGQSDHITSVTEVIGTPYELPMIEDFPDYYEIYEPIMILRPTPEYDNTYWYVDDPADILGPQFANKSGIAYIGFVDSEGPEVINAKSRLSLPKFSTKGHEGILFSLDYFGGLDGKYAAQFQILANSYAKGLQNIADLPKGNGWLTRQIQLPDHYNNLDWVELLIDNTYETDQQFAMFSAYSISSISGVLDTFEDAAGTIRVTPGMIHLIGFRGESLMICDLQGKVMVTRDSLDDINGFAVVPGIYVVRTGSKALKVKVD